MDFHFALDVKIKLMMKSHMKWHDGGLDYNQSDDKYDSKRDRERDVLWVNYLSSDSTSRYAVDYFTTVKKNKKSHHDT